MRLTAAEADAMSRKSAFWLRRNGASPGDRVAVTASGSAQYIAFVAGALRSGVMPVIVNGSATPVDQDYIVQDSDSVVVVGERQIVEACTQDGEANIAPYPLTRPVLYTSGTTGRPKGVVAEPWSDAEASAAHSEERDLWGFEPSDVHYVCSPLYHSAPLRFVLGTLLAGGTVVMPGPFDAQQFVTATAVIRPTTTFCAPTHLRRILSLAPPPAPALRLVAHAGAPCPADIKRAAIDWLPDGAVWEFYGSTEGQFTVCPPGEWLSHPGTVGRARPGRTVDVDATGVVWCTGPSWARWTYWKAPEQTAAAWRGRAFTVGDVGEMRDEYLFLSGRRDDLIITGGVNVYPFQVEEALRRAPGVVDVAVFPRDDPDWGQRVCAVVVGTADEATLRRAAAETLSAPQRPKEYVLRTAIPTTAHGKVPRSKLAGMLAEQPSSPTDA